MPLGSSKRGAPLLLVFQYVHALTSYDFTRTACTGCDLRVIGAGRAAGANAVLRLLKWRHRTQPGNQGNHAGMRAAPLLLSKLASDVT